MNWMLHEVAGCPDCLASRYPDDSQELPQTPTLHTATMHNTEHGHVLGSQQQQQLVHGSSSSRYHLPCGGHRQRLTAGSPTAGSSHVGVERTCSSSPACGDTSQPLHPAMQGSSRHNLHQQQQEVGNELTEGLSCHSVRSSYESDTTEGEHTIRCMRSSRLTSGSAGSTGVAVVPPCSPPVSAFAASSSLPCAADAAVSPAATAAPGCLAVDADGATTGCPKQDTVSSPVPTQQQAQEVSFSGCCCDGHQSMLLQILAHLNWHLLEPRALDRLERLALLGPGALLEIYRWSTWACWPCRPEPNLCICVSRDCCQVQIYWVCRLLAA